MIPELIIIPNLLNRGKYTQYRDSINLSNAKEHMKEVYGLYLTLDKLMNSTKQESFSLDEFEAYYWLQHPLAKKDQYEVISELIFSPLRSSSLEFSENLLVEIDTRARAARISLLAHDVSVGQKEFSSLVESIKEIPEEKSILEDNFVDASLDSVLGRTVMGGGLEWNLSSLNTSLGSIRRGNFGVIFGRPEVGKTTFLASQVTHMAGQCDGPVVWFNNEEDGSAVQLRCYQAALKKDLPWIIVNKELASETYKHFTRGNLRIYDSPSITKKVVEKVVRQLSPRLIVFDKIDFIKGFDAERKDLVLEAIYRWARELAKEYCPVIGVCHADGGSEGVKYITMDHMDNAKTSKQATCDWILGIGQEHKEGMDYVRGLYLSKNKLPGSEKTDPSLRHSKWDVLIHPDIASFEDVKRR